MGISPEIEKMCENSEPPLLKWIGDTYFCVRGGQRCPEGYVCHADPADRFAVCPNKTGIIKFRREKKKQVLWIQSILFNIKST